MTIRDCYNFNLILDTDARYVFILIKNDRWSIQPVNETVVFVRLIDVFQIPVRTRYVFVNIYTGIKDTRATKFSSSITHLATILKELVNFISTVSITYFNRGNRLTELIRRNKIVTKSD